MNEVGKQVSESSKKSQKHTQFTHDGANIFLLKP